MIIGTIMPNPTTTVQQPSSQPSITDTLPILSTGFSPKLTFYIFMLILIVIGGRIADANYKILGNARWANAFEIWACRRKAIAQMLKPKSPNIAVGLGSNHKGNRTQVLLHTLAPGVKVVGASGKGKTESVISSMIDDFAEQGMTLAIYDKKGDLAGMHVAYLMELGYTVWVYPYDGFNPLKKMKGPNDVDGAFSAIHALHENLGGRKKKPEDPFFGGQGQAALKTACLLAKGSVFPDFVMAFAFLSLPGLAKRLAAGEEAGTIGIWARLSSTGLRSIVDAAQTVAGVVGSAVLNIGQLISEKSVQAMIYDDIPLELDGKQAVFFQVDKNREEVSIPSIATAIDLIVKASCGSGLKRKSPFVLICDEKASIDLPNMGQWLSEYRSYWFLMVSAFQNEAQQLMHMEKYEKLSNESNMGTTLYLDANDWESSELISKRCGPTEKKSRDSKGHVTRHKVPLITPNELEQRNPGDTIIFTPGLRKIPWRVQIRINKKDEKRRKANVEIWENNLKPQYEQRLKDRIAACTTETELEDRFAIADILLPPPEVIKAMKLAKNPPEPVQDNSKKRSVIAQIVSGNAHGS